MTNLCTGVVNSGTAVWRCHYRSRYHGPVSGYRTFQELKRAIRERAHARYNFQVNNFGIGEYKIEGGKLRRDLDVRFRDWKVQDA